MKDIPEDFRISFAPKNPNSTEPNQCGVEKSKGMGKFIMKFHNFLQYSYPRNLSFEFSN